jgi:hypothetical protein
MKVESLMRIPLSHSAGRGETGHEPRTSFALPCRTEIAACGNGARRQLRLQKSSATTMMMRMRVPRPIVTLRFIVMSPSNVALP